MKESGIKVRLLFLSFITCLLLIFAIFVVMKQRDNKEPEISFGDEAVFLTTEEAEAVENGDYSCLLNDVTAKDDKDGDLTARLFVDDLNLYLANTYGIIQYKVMDSAGNVTTRQRICYMYSMEEIYAKLSEEYDLIYGKKQTEENTTEISDSSEPIIRVKENVTIAAGSEVNLQDYLEALYDNTDSMQTLWQNIQMDGSYDTSIPGTYVLTFYVTDSDGNVSQPSVMYLTVE